MESRDDLHPMTVHPSKLNLILKHNKALRKASKDFDPESDFAYCRMIADRLVEIMLHHDGIQTTMIGVGMAAPQIGINRRVMVMTTLKKQRASDIWTCFQPEIISHGRQVQYDTEGCLSFPGEFGKVPRFQIIRVKFYNYAGEKIEKELRGWPARVFQHEVDHLNGLVCLDKAKIK